MSNTVNIKNPVEPTTSSANLVSGYNVVLGVSRYVSDDPSWVNDEDGNAATNVLGTLEYIGLISGLNISDGRNVMQQGELGSQTLITLISEGQKSLSFQRLIPFPDNPDGTAAITKLLTYGTILKVLYRHLLTEYSTEILELYSFVIDIEQDPVFRMPIQLVLDIKNEKGDYLSRKWLKNASLAGTTISIGAGSHMTMEPAQISWETSVDLLIDAGDDS